MFANMRKPRNSGQSSVAAYFQNAGNNNVAEEDQEMEELAHDDGREDSKRETRHAI